MNNKQIKIHNDFLKEVEKIKLYYEKTLGISNSENYYYFVYEEYKHYLDSMTFYSDTKENYIDNSLKEILFGKVFDLDNLEYEIERIENDIYENDIYHVSDECETDYSPGRPWDAPGMHISDFI